MKFPVNLSLQVLFFFGMMALNSCGSKNEGCIDPNASNFDVTADVNCCCEYPQLGLYFNFLNVDTTFSYSTILYDDNSHPFQIRKLKFYISDIKFNTNNNTIYRYDNRIWIYPYSSNGMDSLSAIDDYLLIEPTSNRNLGFRFDQPIFLNSFEFLAGVKDSAQLCNPMLVKPFSHPLNIGIDSMYDFSEKHYGVLKLVVQPNLDTTLTDTFFIADLTDRISVIKPLNEPLGLGYNIYLDVNLQVNRLVDGIDFRNPDKTVILTQLRNNLSQFFE